MVSTGGYEVHSIASTLQKTDRNCPEMKSFKVTLVIINLIQRRKGTHRIAD